MSSDNFEFESIQDTQTIKKLMLSLVDGIVAGRIVLSSNGEDIVMRPSSMLKLSVRAKKKGETGKISLKISWKERKNEGVLTSDQIAITSSPDNK